MLLTDPHAGTANFEETRHQHTHTIYQLISLLLVHVLVILSTQVHTHNIRQVQNTGMIDFYSCSHLWKYDLSNNDCLWSALKLFGLLMFLLTDWKYTSQRINVMMKIDLILEPYSSCYSIQQLLLCSCLCLSMNNCIHTVNRLPPTVNITFRLFFRTEISSFCFHTL